MPSTDNITCFLVQQNEAGECAGSLQTITYEDYPEGDLIVEPTLSSLNYKDALAATGHRGVIGKLPHVPGIDMVGIVRETQNVDFPVGSEIAMMGSGFGSEKWGGWSRTVRLISEEVFRLPDGLSGLQAMSLGTAGFTAAQSVEALIAHEVNPEGGPIIVTGATGGVGSLATMMLAEQGFQVTAVTGKTDRHDWLRDLGASDIIDRHELLGSKNKPLMTAKWGGAIDTVGGDLLSLILKQTKPLGCVTACGMAGGNDLNTTVFPFILRGVTLVGIDSAGCPLEKRKRLWEKIAQQYLPSQIDKIVQIVPLSEIQPHVEKMLAGETFGRIVVDVTK